MAQANQWFSRQPWLLGSNYVPANAINQLEMWQAATFDPARIDLELGWAENPGMNTMRVFLHDLPYQQDPAGFEERIDVFLSIAASHHIRPILVLFDSCWDPNPKLGPQHPPVPGVHNSGWVQSPAADELADPRKYRVLEDYVEGIVGAFGQDPRVLAWDIWNEPQNHGGGEGYYESGEAPHKLARVLELLPQAFAWARSRHPLQPLTSAVSSQDDWSQISKLDPIEAMQLEQSDVISFHDYNWPERFETRIRQLTQYGRPLICTEYLARGVGSTIDGSLPIGKNLHVGMVN